MDLVPAELLPPEGQPLPTGPLPAVVLEPPPPAMRQPMVPPMIVAPPVPDERTQTAHCARVGLAIVVVLSGLVAAFLCWG